MLESIILSLGGTIPDKADADMLLHQLRSHVNQFERQHKSSDASELEEDED